MDDDMILPDDFESPTSEEAETVEPEYEEIETEQTDEPTSDPAPVDEPQAPEIPQMLKIKVDRQEREIPLEEAAVLAQKGLNYERAIERARAEAAQQAKDALIADMGYTWNGQAITTEAQYKQALAEQELINKYKDRDLPEELIKELMESRRDREERAREKQEKETADRQQKAYNEFFEYFESVNDRRFDANKDTIPQEVIEAANAGQPLKYAYMEYHNKQLRNQLKVSKQNETNTQKAPVRSVTSHGNNKTEPVDDFLAGFNSI